MLRHFDHVTVVVRDLEAAQHFFGLLGFEHEQSVVISGADFARYMGIPGAEADHVTLVLSGARPRAEVQLLHYRTPEALANPDVETLRMLGFNHVCFDVADLAAELARLRTAGVEPRSPVLDFHGRKLVFLRGPEGITIELSERYAGGAQNAPAR